MSVSPEQFESIKRWRGVFFRSADGRETLGELLGKLGLFAEGNDRIPDDPVAVGLLFAGLEILAELGIWRTDMFDKLIEAMAAMPMPDVENQ